MSLKHHNFTLDLNLEHISLVRIAEQLWRQKDISARVYHYVVDAPRQPHQKSYESIYYKIYRETSVSSEIIEDITEKNVAILPLPPVIKHKLKYYVREMGKIMFFWLFKTWSSMNAHKDNEAKDKLVFFTKNIKWTDVGFIDGKKMLESFIEKKEIINLCTTMQLANYCSEKSLIKFKNCIQWDDWYRRDAIACTLWHQIIHGKKYSKTQISYSIQELIRVVCQYAMEHGHISALYYYWGKYNLPTDGFLPPVYEKYFFRHSNDTSITYGFILAETGQKQISSFFENYDKPFHSDHATHFTNFPWLPLITSWREFFSSLTNEYQFMTSLYYQILENLANETKKYGYNASNNPFYQRNLQIFEELWETQLRRWFFRQTTNELKRASSLALSTQEPIVCRAILGVTKEWRKELINRLENFSPWEFFDGTINESFYKILMNEILQSEEERNFYESTEDIMLLNRLRCLYLSGATLPLESNIFPHSCEYRPPLRSTPPTVEALRQQFFL